MLWLNLWAGLSGGAKVKVLIIEANLSTLLESAENVIAVMVGIN